MAKVKTQKKARNGSSKLQLTRKQLESVTKIIGVVDLEAFFNIEKDKITTKVVDGSHVSLIELTWPAEAFQNYETTEQVVGVDSLKDLLFAVKTAGMNDTITIEVDKYSNYTISTEYQTAQIRSLDDRNNPEVKSPILDGTDYAQVFDVPSDFLRTALNGLDRKSQLVNFGVDGRNIHIFASNLDGDKWDYNFECKKKYGNFTKL